ncbi:MAG: chromosome partitioning protein ParB, partial [Leptonema sp. (in: Bacteria)]|nr:chromosome partitioning protein ParB [Leptonema sp. (in: bacteria)]
NAEEEADALIKLKKQENLSDQEVAKLIGKSRNYVTEILSISNLPESYIAECRSRGLTQKNFLIQAVQAFKRGTHQEFLDAFSEGEIRTVREAKDFNQNRTTQVRAHERSAKPANTETTIQRKGNQITILSTDSKTARRIETWLRKNIDQLDFQE